MTRRPFLASALAVLLTSLSACGGGGDSGGSSDDNAAKVLFVPDKAHAVVGALSTLSPAVGNVRIDNFAFA